jgi:Uma2 family endonuclease
LKGTAINKPDSQGIHENIQRFLIPNSGLQYRPRRFSCEYFLYLQGVRKFPLICME